MTLSGRDTVVGRDGRFLVANAAKARLVMEAQSGTLVELVADLRADCIRSLVGHSVGPGFRKRLSAAQTSDSDGLTVSLLDDLRGRQR